MLTYARLGLLFSVAYVLPPMLLFVGFIPFEWRFHVLMCVTLLLLVFVCTSGYSPRNLGLRVDNLPAALGYNIAIIMAVIVLLEILLPRVNLRSVPGPEWNGFYFFYVFISSPAQEFAYRSVFFAVMNRVGVSSPVFFIGVSALSYSLVHIIYRDPITLAVTFVAGVVWAVAYHRAPNLLGVSMSHAAVGAASINAGLV
jgi:uncharacterized protein